MKTKIKNLRFADNRLDGLRPVQYARSPGDKFRPIKIVRPTLRQIEVTLRNIAKNLRVAGRALRSKNAGDQMRARADMAKLYTHRSNIEKYFRNLATA